MKLNAASLVSIAGTVQRTAQMRVPFFCGDPTSKQEPPPAATCVAVETLFHLKRGAHQKDKQ